MNAGLRLTDSVSFLWHRNTPAKDQDRTSSIRIWAWLLARGPLLSFRMEKFFTESSTVGRSSLVFSSD